MKKIVAMAMSAFMVLSLAACGSSDEKLKVGIMQYAQHPALDAANKGFMDAMKDNGFGEDKVDFDYQNAQNEIPNCETIASKFVNDGVDLIYAIATPTVQAAASATAEVSIPIVLSSVTDPASAGVVESNEKPGGNVTGVSDLTPIKDQMELLKQLIPDAETVAIMYCSSEDNSIFQADIAKKEAEALGLKWQDVTVADATQIQQVTESLIGKVDAIYIPTDNMLADAMATVSMVATDNKIPVIVGECGMVENGGLATYGLDYYTIGYLAGEQAAKILKGEAEPKDMPIEYLGKDKTTLMINKKTAEKLNITIPEDLKAKAEMVE